jgi:hypothetical protein
VTAVVCDPAAAPGVTKAERRYDVDVEDSADEDGAASGAPDRLCEVQADGDSACQGADHREAKAGVAILLSVVSLDVGRAAVKRPVKPPPIWVRRWPIVKRICYVCNCWVKYEWAFYNKEGFCHCLGPELLNTHEWHCASCHVAYLLKGGKV